MLLAERGLSSKFARVLIPSRRSAKGASLGDWSGRAGNLLQMAAWSLVGGRRKRTKVPQRPRGAGDYAKRLWPGGKRVDRGLAFHNGGLGRLCPLFGLGLFTFSDRFLRARGVSISRPLSRAASRTPGRWLLRPCSARSSARRSRSRTAGLLAGFNWDRSHPLDFIRGG